MNSLASMGPSESPSSGSDGAVVMRPMVSAGSASGRARDKPPALAVGFMTMQLSTDEATAILAALGDGCEYTSTMLATRLGLDSKRVAYALGRMRQRDIVSARWVEHEPPNMDYSGMRLWKRL